MGVHEFTRKTVCKWRKIRTVAALPRSGRPANITPILSSDLDPTEMLWFDPKGAVQSRCPRNTDELKQERLKDAQVSEAATGKKSTGDCCC